MKIKHLKLLIK